MGAKSQSPQLRAAGDLAAFVVGGSGPPFVKLLRAAFLIPHPKRDGEDDENEDTADYDKSCHCFPFYFPQINADLK